MLFVGLLYGACAWVCEYVCIYMNSSQQLQCPAGMDVTMMVGEL